MPFTRTVRLIMFLAAAGLPAALCGCGGSSTAEVSGTITLSGQRPNLKGMQIVFISTEGVAVAAIVGEDGTYKAVQVPVGNDGVGFVYVPLEIVQHAKSGSAMKLPKPGNVAEFGPPPPPVFNPIPDQLRNAGTSKVTAKVASGKNVFNYDIKP